MNLEHSILKSNCFSGNNVIPFSFNGHPGELVALFIDNSIFTSRFFGQQNEVITQKRLLPEGGDYF
jgi:hypothetical protein